MLPLNLLGVGHQQNLGVTRDKLYVQLTAVPRLPQAGMIARSRLTLSWI